MARRHTVTLTIGDPGVEITTWDEISITQDLMSAVGAWTLTVWRDADPARWEAVRRACRIYAPVVLRVDGAVQFRGVLERVRGGGSRAGAPLTFSGRSLAGPAMSAHVDPRISFRGLTLAEALVRIFERLGIAVTVGVRAADARAIQAGSRPGPVRSGSGHHTSTQRRSHHVDRYRPEPKTTSWQVAETLCRRHGYILYPAPTTDGMGLVLDKPAYDAPVEYALTRTKVRTTVRTTTAGDESVTTWSGNIVDGFRDTNGTDTPTEVTVFGHSGLDAPQDTRHRGVVENTALVNHPLVNEVYLQRPWYVRDKRATTPLIAEQRARREIATSMAEFDVWEGSVQGFSQGTAPARNWAINAMCHIDDELAFVREDWLTTRVTFVRSRAGGHATKLRLVPKGSIVIEPDGEV